MEVAGMSYADWYRRKSSEIAEVEDWRIEG